MQHGKLFEIHDVVLLIMILLKVFAATYLKDFTLQF